MGSRGAIPSRAAASAAVCSHLNITEVVAWSEEEPIAYICLSPECYAQLDLDDPAVKWHLDRAELRSSFSAPSLEEKAREVRAYSVENAWVQINPFTEDTAARMRKAVRDNMAKRGELASEIRRHQEAERRHMDRELRRERADQLWAEMRPEDANDGVPDKTEV